MKPPLLSIGLFVYNGERFLAETLDSLLAQTWTDYELIISDNGSTDGTPAICEHYASLDKRIRYYRSPTNRGAGWNIRRGDSLATGKYFKWAACDDLYEPTFLQACVEALEGIEGYVLAHAKTRVIDAEGKLVENYEWPMRTDSPDAVTRIREMLLNDLMSYQI